MSHDLSKIYFPLQELALLLDGAAVSMSIESYSIMLTAYWGKQAVQLSLSFDDVERTTIADIAKMLSRNKSVSS
jgi:hypothetical protein